MEDTRGERRSVPIQNYRSALRFRDRGVSGDLETPRMRANVSLLIPRRHLLLARSLARRVINLREYATARSACVLSRPYAGACIAREECKCRARGYRYSYPIFPSNLSTCIKYTYSREWTRMFETFPALFQVFYKLDERLKETWWWMYTLPVRIIRKKIRVFKFLKFLYLSKSNLKFF